MSHQLSRNFLNWPVAGFDGAEYLAGVNNTQPTERVFETAFDSHLLSNDDVAGETL